MANFANELKSLETLQHTGIARVYELIHDTKNFYIVMEKVSSMDMYKYLNMRNKRLGRMEEAEVRTIAL